MGNYTMCGYLTKNKENSSVIAESNSTMEYNKNSSENGLSSDEAIILFNDFLQ